MLCSARDLNCTQKVWGSMYTFASKWLWRGTSQGWIFCPNCMASLNIKTHVQHHTSTRIGGKRPPEVGHSGGFSDTDSTSLPAYRLGCTTSQATKGLLDTKLIWLSTCVSAAESQNQSWWPNKTVAGAKGRGANCSKPLSDNQGRLLTQRNCCQFPRHDDATVILWFSRILIF